MLFIFLYREKVDIAKLQLKLFAGPNGINVLNLIPGKSPTFPRKSSPKAIIHDEVVVEAPRPPIERPTIKLGTERATMGPTIKLEIDLDSDSDDVIRVERQFQVRFTSIVAVSLYFSSFSVQKKEAKKLGFV